jgi:hypothetical protein
LSVSHHSLGQTVFVSHFPRFSFFFVIIQVLPCEFLIFYVFQCFSAYSMFYKCVFLIFHDFSFLAIFFVLQWTFLIFQLFQDS